MTCDIVIRSYYKDFRWLDWCLRSIERFCIGFGHAILVVPEASRERLDWLGLSGDRTITCPDYADDYLGQQVTKLYADRFSDADYICHVDSDCVFVQPVRPDTLFEQGLPRLTMVPYRTLDRHVPWRGLTERFIGAPVEYEFMRSPPYMFPRWLYPALRRHVRALHGVTAEHYVLSQPPRGFSEINALAAYAYVHERDAFTWIDLSRASAPEALCRAYWSWGGIDAGTEAELEALLGAVA